ncbi:hypothetical protein U1Q18_052066 [Sarracenia purpurea var. burkii]
MAASSVVVTVVVAGLSALLLFMKARQLSAKLQSWLASRGGQPNANVCTSRRPPFEDDGQPQHSVEDAREYVAAWVLRNEKPIEEQIAAWENYDRKEYTEFMQALLPNFPLGANF